MVKKNFTFEELATSNTRAEILLQEEYYVELFDTFKKWV